MEDLQERVEETVDNTDYIAAIKELKQNSVSKSDYDKIKEENRKLLKSLVDNDFSQQKEETPVEKPNIGELRQKLFKGELNNLEYCQTALDLRNAIIEEGGVDPFLPQGVDISYDDNDVKAANSVADALQHCIEYAEGDSSVFTNELQRITVDNIIKRK